MIILTRDGSATIRKDASGITYHSIHGALQESKHVYLEAGLEYWLKENPAAKSARIFEMGFGTGLNALLTALKAESMELKIYYTAIDNEPISSGEADSLKYDELLNATELFKKLHEVPWRNRFVLSTPGQRDDIDKNELDGQCLTAQKNTPGLYPISEFFLLEKRLENLLDFSDHQQYDIIYFDAFAPTAQPELWSEAVFSKMHSILAPGGCLVTYCSKSIIRRAMMAAGFQVTKPQGPWGKREMVRAFPSQFTRTI